MNVRSGAEGDHASAVAVWRAAQGGRGQRPPATRVARVEEKLAAPGTLLVVAVEGDDVVGMTLGEPGVLADGAGDLDPELLHLSMLFVAPSHQRKGVGSSLIEGIADAAWERGYRQLSVWTRSSNTAALALYEACGLEPADRTQELADGSTAEQWTAELEAPVRAVVLHSDGLRLGQLLKLAELVDTGAEAKVLLSEGEVEVNGEVEMRRGRQMVAGDVVSARDQTVQLVLPD